MQRFDDDVDDAPLWVRIALMDLQTRKRASFFCYASAALGVVMIGAGFVEPQAAWMATAFFAAAAWVQSSIFWMDARRAW